MREYEFCCICKEFTSCFRYRKHWLCDQCEKSKLDEYLEDNEIDTTPKIKIKIKGEKCEPKIKKKRKTERKPRRKTINNRKSCKNDLLDFFNANVDEVFRSYELWDKFPEYKVKHIKNSLSTLVRENKIFSRRINIKGHIALALYSTNPDNVKKRIDEEGIKKIETYITNINEPITTKELSKIFNISSEGIIKRLKHTRIERFQHMNRNFYFSPEIRDRAIESILKTTKWGR